MADLVRIVDSIAASPTVLLDLNDETSWWTRSLKAPPPRLRRSTAQNSMRDGDYTAAATYGSRILELVLESRESTQDAAAAEMQTLFRLLDGADGKFLQYQPQGASKPVFFVLERSDLSDLSDVMAQAAMRAFTVELKAEPFALGLMETLGPYTVSNDPAAATNRCYFDVTGVLGDVAVPAVLSISPPSGVSDPGWHLSSEIDPSGSPTMQAESFTAETDTSNIGGGPDAAMSGTGTNNFLRTTFATDASMEIRWSGPAQTTSGGLRRVFAIVRRSDATSVINLRLTADDTVGATVPTQETTERQMVDLGLVDTGSRFTVGYESDNTATSVNMTFQAERVSGTGTLDWDFAYFMPAHLQSLSITNAGVASTQALVLDGLNEVAIATFSGDPLAGGAILKSQQGASVTGSYPNITPEVTTRFHLLTWSSTLLVVNRDVQVSSVHTVTVNYWPRYLFVRPSAS